ncbi:MAG: hypothetical protein KC766_28980 [Myxococcales bacterium]|nr:hypothetical protein [Myxococcales bacterium]
MRNQLWIPLCCLTLTLGCTAKERENGVESGGSAGQGANGGTAGSGAEGGSGGANGGSAGSATGGSGAGGAGATGGSGASGGSGAAAGTGGTGGTGGNGLKCTPGPVTELTTDTSRPALNDEPDIAVTRCGEDGWLAMQTGMGIDIFRIRFGQDGNPIAGSWFLDFPDSHVHGLSCDVNNLRILTQNANGANEILLPFAGQDLTTPLMPTAAGVTIPNSCVGNIRGFLPSYNGGLHWMIECQPDASKTTISAGPPIVDFVNGPPSESLSLAAYAYAGGIHVGMNEKGEGWAGATAAQLGTLQKIAFEDPAARPTGLATITANSQGFFVMGLTTSPPPNLLPGRLFTGQIPPSKINEIFVGGQLPPTVAYRREITSTDEIGPTSQLSQGSNTVVFSTINLSGDVLISILGSDGKIIDWADTIYQPSNVTVRRTYALTNGPGNGNIVAWAEYDANNKYRAYVRSMLCF